MNGCRVAAAALLLLAGFAVYVLWRPNALVLFDGLEAIGLGAAITALRGAAAPFGNALPVWFVYSVPYALWVASWVVLMSGVWHEQPGRERWVWTLGVPLLAAGAEVAPTVLRSFPGTFDPVDLFMISVSVPLAMILS